MKIEAVKSESNHKAVIPAQAGIHLPSSTAGRNWIPAFAGMTI
jgi:hypothetical protein